MWSSLITDTPELDRPGLQPGDSGVFVKVPETEVILEPSGEWFLVMAAGTVNQHWKTVVPLLIFIDLLQMTLVWSFWW